MCHITQTYCVPVGSPNLIANQIIKVSNSLRMYGLWTKQNILTFFRFQLTVCSPDETLESTLKQVWLLLGVSRHARRRVNWVG